MLGSRVFSFYRYLTCSSQRVFLNQCVYARFPCVFVLTISHLPSEETLVNDIDRPEDESFPLQSNQQLLSLLGNKNKNINPDALNLISPLPCLSTICIVTSSCICKTVPDWSLLLAGKLHHFLFKVTTCSDLKIAVFRDIGQLAVAPYMGIMGLKR